MSDDYSQHDNEIRQFKEQILLFPLIRLKFKKASQVIRKNNHPFLLSNDHLRPPKQY